MSTAIIVILLNIVTDMTPYFSILEVKFIEIFRYNADIIMKKKGNMLTTFGNDDQHGTESLLANQPDKPQVSGSPRILLTPDEESKQVTV